MMRFLRLILDSATLCAIWVVIAVLHFNVEAEIYHLDLATAKKIALEKNPELLLSGMDLQSARASFSAFNAGLYPQLSLDVTAPSYNESLSEQYVYQPSNSTYAWQWISTGDYRYQGSLNLEQKLPTGATFTISDILYKRDYFYGSSADSLVTEYSNAVRFSLQQPLLQSNSVKFERLKSLLNLETAKLNRQIKLRDLDIVISTAYYSLVRAERRLNLEREDFARWNSSVETANDKFRAGLLPEVEVFKLKVELARREGSLATTSGNYQEAVDNLKLMLGLNFEDSIAVSPVVEEFAVPESDYDRALELRQELKKAEIDLKNAELNYKQSRKNAGLNASLMAYYDLDSKQDYFEDLTDNPQTDRGISLTVSLPIYDWGAAKNQVEITHIALKKNRFNYQQQRREFLTELASVQRSLEAAKKRLRSARLAEELAQKTYEITRSRFDSGAVTATDLIDAQISLNQVRHELLDATIDYNLVAVKYKILFFPEVTMEP